jgi:hypothetical protein
MNVNGLRFRKGIHRFVPVSTSLRLCVFAVPFTVFSTTKWGA